MSYKQNNPFSRKSSPLNGEGDKCPDSGCVQEAGDGRWNVISGITGKDWPSTFPSRESAENAIKKYHAGGFSRQPSSPLNQKNWRDDESKSTRQPSGGNKGPSRKSSSPLNQDERSGPTFLDKVKGTAKNIGSYISDVPGKLRQTNLPVLRPTGYDLPKQHQGKFVASEREEEKARLTQSAKERQARVSKGSAFFRKSSPLNNTGMTGLNYSKELRYNAVDDITQGKGEADYGFSRESSSPLDFGSWAHHDAVEAGIDYGKGDYAHARALGIDEHDADYAKHWHKDEAEHGPSRKSRSERLRNRAMKRSERSGAEWGDYDYEDPRVQKMLSKAAELDERSGKEMKRTMTKHIEPLPKKKA